MFCSVSGSLLIHRRVCRIGEVMAMGRPPSKSLPPQNKGGLLEMSRAMNDSPASPALNSTAAPPS
jgi:hypothetical protein